MKKVAIVGVEGSGKTVFLAAMGRKYESPDENGVFLTPLNRRTYSYYVRAMASLQNGEWPLPTQPGDVVELDWQLRVKGGSGGSDESLAQLSFLDFAGEVYRKAFGGSVESDKTADNERMPQEAVDRLRSHVRDADVLIVLVDLGKVVNGDEREERTVEMNWLSQAILSFAYEEAHKQVVALVFTQSDRYKETMRQCGGVRGALAKYLRIVDSNYGDRLSLFEVSAVNATVPSPDNATVFLPAKDFGSRGFEDLMSWLVGRLRGDEGKRRPSLWKLFLWLMGLCLVLGGLYVLALFFPEVSADVMRFVGLNADEVAVQKTLKPVSVDETAMRKAEEAERKAAAEAEAKRKAEEAAVETRRKAEEKARRRAAAIAAAKPGYVWDDERAQYFWTKGLRHPDNGKLVSGNLKDTWKSTVDGYAWLGGSDTAWMAGLPHSKIPHVKSAVKDKKRYWKADPGYKWAERGDMSKGVVWNPGEVDGDRKAGTAEGRWLRKCGACGGTGLKDCWECSGTRKVNCPACRGSKMVQEGEICWMCKGTGRYSKPCECLFGILPLVGTVLNLATLNPKVVECSNCKDGMKEVDCKYCNKTGHIAKSGTVFCAECSGKGLVACWKCVGRLDGKLTCPTCRGAGWLDETPAYR